MRCRALIAGVFVLPVAAQAQGGETPYVGKWKCPTGIFTFTTTEMIAPQQRAKIEKVTRRSGNTYSLVINGADERLKFTNPRTFMWDSGDGQPPLKCTRV